MAIREIWKSSLNSHRLEQNYIRYLLHSIWSGKQSHESNLLKSLFFVPRSEHCGIAKLVSGANTLKVPYCISQTCSHSLLGLPFCVPDDCFRPAALQFLSCPNFLSSMLLLWKAADKLISATRGTNPTVLIC